MESMRALVKEEAAPGAVLTEVPIPTPGIDEVLVKIKATSICGTDIHIYTWDNWAANRIKTPYIFGHEFAGEVVAIGKNVTSIAVGDHIAAETRTVCGHCPSCRRGEFHVCLHMKIIGVDRDGCFTEFIALPAFNCWRIDKTLPFQTASIMEPLGNAVHTVFSGEISCKTLAIVGCGPIGLMSIAVARQAGASMIIATDLNDRRLELAKLMGATHIINASNDDPVEQVHALTSGFGTDVVFEMSGHPVGINQALTMVSFGGRVSMLGISSESVKINISDHIVMKGITIFGITGRRMFKTWEQTTRLLEGGLNISPLITHNFSLEQYEEAFDLMKSGQSGKITFTI